MWVLRLAQPICVTSNGEWKEEQNISELQLVLPKAGKQYATCGFDPAPAMVASARERFPAITFEELNSPSLPLAEASEDATLLFSVLTCVPTDDGQRTIVEEVDRVLRPGGLFYISDLWLQTDERNTERYIRDQPKYGIYGAFDLPEGVTVRHHDPRWIESLTRDFNTLALDQIDVVTMNGHPAKGFQWFGVKSNRIQAISLGGVGTVTSVQLNHTIVWCRDKEKSAASLIELLGLPAPIPFGPMLVVKFNNSVSLDFYESDDDISSQHYAFLVSEDEFDEVLGRIRNRGLPYWADPGKAKGRLGEIYEHNGGRGVYFEDPDGHLLEVMTRPYAMGG